MFDFDQALLRAPSVSVVRGLRARPGPPIDPFALAQEHAAYAAALEAAGLAVEILPPLEAFPDSVFVEDPALVFSAGAVLLRPGAASRRGEAAALKSALERRLGRVEALGEGSVDGGDVLALPGKVLIGLSERTDAQGAAALARILGRFGLAAEPVATPGALLHLKSGASLVDEETVVLTEALADSPMFERLRRIVIPPDEASAANVLRVRGKVLLAQGAPRTAELIAALGLEVVGLATRRINALDAGLTCLSLRWRSGA